MQRVYVKFGPEDVKRYYDRLSGYCDRKGAAFLHHVDCLQSPLSGAILYLDLAEELAKSGTYFGTDIRSQCAQVVEAVKPRINNLRSGIIPEICTNFPPEKPLCEKYVEGVNVFANSLPDYLEFPFWRPFLRDCDDAIDMANIMFSPGPIDMHVIYRLRPHHRGWHKILFELNDLRERPVVPV